MCVTLEGTRWPCSDCADWTEYREFNLRSLISPFTSYPKFGAFSPTLDKVGKWLPCECTNFPLNGKNQSHSANVLVETTRMLKITSKFTAIEQRLCTCDHPLIFQKVLVCFPIFLPSDLSNSFAYLMLKSLSISSFQRPSSWNNPCWYRLPSSSHVYTKRGMYSIGLMGYFKHLLTGVFLVFKTF